MPYIALYRKFRPQTFEEIKGQDHVVTALKNQLQQGRIGHSYLFTGTRGTGKTSAARILAKAVNCLHPVNGEPCNTCEHCSAVNAGNFADVVEVDAASNNGVDDIRRLIEEVRYTPIRGQYKVYIIDEAHMITGAAFNAFLKTLEEPPAYAVFILATTEPHKLPVTILSRCQRYDFRRITTEEIAGNLSKIVQQEGVLAEEKALRYIARIGDGSMRDSISLLDKCIAFHLGDALTYDNVLATLGSVDTEVFSRLFQSVYRADTVSALNIIDQAAADGRDLTQFTGEWIRYIRNLLFIRAAGAADPDMLGVSEENMRQMAADARIAEQAVLIRYIHELSELQNRLRYASDKQILIETCAICLSAPQMETDVRSLLDRIRQLEQRIESSPPVLQNGPVPGRMPVPDSQPVMEDQPVPDRIPIPDSMRNPDVFADLMDLPPEPEVLYAQTAPLQAAAPAEPAGSGVQDIWADLTARCGNGRIRATMKKCSAVMSEDGVLRIYTPNVILMKQMQEEQTQQMLQTLTEEITGRKVTVSVLQGTGAEEKQQNGAQFPEELLKNINMKIGTEEY